MEKIKLSDDQKAVVVRRVQDICSAAIHLRDLVKKDDLYPDMQEVIPHNIEYCLSDLCKAVGYDSDTEDKIEKRHEDLRKANMKIHELEKQMGEQADVHIVPRVLKYLHDKVCEFWKTDGFGHVSECDFTQNGMCKIKLSGMLFPDMGLVIHSDTPETDKITSAQWIQNLIDRGFELTKESESSRRPEFVVDNEKNRDLISSTITRRFPSSKILGYTNSLIFQRTDIYSISDIEVLIYELSDI